MSFIEPEYIPFRTTAEQKELLRASADELTAMLYGIEPDRSLIEDMLEIASFDQGVYELVELFVNVKNREEAEELVQDLRNAVSDYRRF